MGFLEYLHNTTIFSSAFKHFYKVNLNHIVIWFHEVNLEYNQIKLWHCLLLMRKIQHIRFCVHVISYTNQLETEH